MPLKLQNVNLRNGYVDPRHFIDLLILIVINQFIFVQGDVHSL